MYEQNASSFIVLAQKLKGLEDVIREQVRDANDPEQWGRAIPAKGALWPFVLQTFQETIKLSNSLELKVTAASGLRFIKTTSSDRYTPTYEMVANALTEINNRLSDELEGRLFVSLSTIEMKYYRPETYLFGIEFDVGFARSGAFELDEAAKCIALGRPTAAVFHLVRLMEIGIGAVARCLQIPDPVRPSERNWGRILENVQKGIDHRWPHSTDRMQGDGALFESLHASLDAVKNPWRNATMHVEHKYTLEDAEHIFVAVRGFMKKLASRCNENGEPKA
jgi:hypothetical protein